MPFRRTSIDSNQRTGFYPPKRSRVVGSRVVGYDSDALVYINAVEAADGQALEGSVKDAYNTFVVGCKSDGIWSAIKASCIMAGARTLSGALVPLVGVAPSGFNLASGTYSRITGLKGDGAAMYLNSNRLISADPVNNSHLAVFGSFTSSGDAYVIGEQGDTSLTALRCSSNTFNGYYRDATFTTYASGANVTTFLGATKTSSSFYNSRVINVSRTHFTTPNLTTVYSRGAGVFTLILTTGATTARAPYSLSFYSIGQALDLAKLDARVSGLMVAISGAIS